MDARYLGGLISRITKGAKVVIVSNREPVMHERDVGGIRVVRPASAMVAALEPIVRATGGIWVAHGSGSADHLVTDEKGRIALPPEDPRYTLRRVWLTRKEEEGYYYNLKRFQSDLRSAHNFIGQGGMGSVYRGIDSQTGEPVAIKILKKDIIDRDPEALRRFRQEGEAMRQLNHPNIVKMLGEEEQDGVHYLVMEYVGGGSLRDVLDNSPKLSIQRALYVALDLADALTRAHRLNILHRDIKPANVLIATDGTPRLTDFGMARMGTEPHITQDGAIVGTMAYLAPEAFQGADFIRYKGRNISSFQVEAAFMAHPAVAQCAAHAVTSAELESEAEMKLCVVLKPGQTATPEELCRFVNDSAPYFFVPRFVELMTALPSTPTGRVQKYKLRERGVTPDTWDARQAGFVVKR